MQWAFTGRDGELAQLRHSLSSGPETGVLIAGAAGVGKSRLLNELAAAETAHGVVTSSFPASAATSSIPFAAFGALVPQAGARDELDLLRHMHRALIDRAHGRRSLVLVDDAHALDGMSVAFVHHLVTAGDVHLALAIRSDREIPEGITELWKDRLVDRIDLQPLDRDAFEDLVHSALTGAVAHDVAQRLWETTLGHPLYLRLLVDAAIESETLRRDAGLWRWAPQTAGMPSAAASRLAELVRGRTSALDATSKDALNLLALAETLPAPIAEALIADSVLARLESRGLVLHVSERDCSTVRIGHPLFAEAVVSGLRPAERRVYARRLADAWATSDAPGARLDEARWRLETGSTLRGSLAEAAARDALIRLDVPLAERLARAAVDADASSSSAHFLLAEALRSRGRGDEAARHLARAAVLATDDDSRVEIAITRAKTEALVNRRPDRALALLRRSMRVVRDPIGRRRLAAERTYVRTFTGDLGQSPTPTPAQPAEDAGAVPGVTPILIRAYAKALALELDDVEDLFARGFEIAAARGDDAPHAVPLLDVARALARIGQGRAAEAFRTARAARTAECGPVAAGHWSFCTAFTAGLTGDLDEGTNAGLEARRWFDEIDPFGLGETAAVVAAVTALQAGRADAAALLMDSVPPRESSPSARIRAVVDQRVVAWQAISRQALDEGARASARAGRAAVEAGERLWGAIALYDAVRVGRPELVLDDLHDLDEECSSELVELFLAHAIARADDAPRALESVAQRFRAAGCRLFASEADAHAARSASRQGDTAAAARAATRAWLQWETCTGRTLPSALVESPRGLSRRQREIARLACDGHSSREIADLLVISVRTVDNHLGSAYRALDVGGRDEMAAVLTIDD